MHTGGGRIWLVVLPFYLSVLKSGAPSAFFEATFLWYLSGALLLCLRWNCAPWPISGWPRDLNTSQLAKTSTTQNFPKTLWDQGKSYRQGSNFAKRFLSFLKSENYFEPGFSGLKVGNFSAPAKRTKNHQLQAPKIRLQNYFQTPGRTP